MSSAVKSLEAFTQLRSLAISDVWTSHPVSPGTRRSCAAIVASSNSEGAATAGWRSRGCRRLTYHAAPAATATSATPAGASLHVRERRAPTAVFREASEFAMEDQIPSGADATGSLSASRIPKVISSSSARHAAQPRRCAATQAPRSGESSFCRYADRSRETWLPSILYTVPRRVWSRSARIRCPRFSRDATVPGEQPSAAAISE